MVMSKEYLRSIGLESDITDNMPETEAEAANLRKKMEYGVTDLSVQTVAWDTPPEDYPFSVDIHTKLHETLSDTYDYREQLNWLEVNEINHVYDDSTPPEGVEINTIRFWFKTKNDAKQFDKRFNHQSNIFTKLTKYFAK